MLSENIAKVMDFDVPPIETFYEESNITLERLVKLEDITKEETENLLRTIGNLSYDTAEAN